MGPPDLNGLPSKQPPDHQEDDCNLLRVDRYTLLTCIGSGSCGAVFIGIDNVSSCIYALKKIQLCNYNNQLSTLSDGRPLSAYQRETNANTNTEVCALRHLNVRPHASIPTFYRAFNAQNSLFIVMERVSGLTLTELLTRYRTISGGVLPTLPRYYLKFVVRGLLKVLHHCHQNGVAHLDVKPDNINVVSPNRIFLMDYGQSYSIREGISDDPWLDSRVGAMAFLPPEVLTSSTLYTNSYLNLKNLVSNFVCDSNLTNENSTSLKKQSILNDNNEKLNLAKESLKSSKSIHKLRCSSSSSIQDAESSRTRSTSLSVSYTTMHHVSTLFLQEYASGQTPEQYLLFSSNHRFYLWINGLRRIAKFIEIDRPHSPPLQVSFENGSVKLNSTKIKDLMEISETLNDNASKYNTINETSPMFDPLENTFPLASDLLEIGVKLGVPELKGTTLHVFNSKIAIDSWVVGLVLLISIIGGYPFRDVTAFEIIPLVQLMAEAIRQQLDETIKAIARDNFKEYNSYLKIVSEEASCDFCGNCSLCLLERDFSNSQFRKSIKAFLRQPVLPPASIIISENGPLPTDLPLDLFLLIAGLLHPNPKARLSVSEALACPWLTNINEFSIQEHEYYTSMESLNIFKMEVKQPKVAKQNEVNFDSVGSNIDKFVKSVKEFHRTSRKNLATEDLKPPACRGDVARMHSQNDTIPRATDPCDHFHSNAISRKYSSASGIPEMQSYTAVCSESVASILSSNTLDDHCPVAKPFDFEAYQQGKLCCDKDAHKIIFDVSHDNSSTSSSSL